MLWSHARSRASVGDRVRVRSSGRVAPPRAELAGRTGWCGRLASRRHVAYRQSAPRRTSSSAVGCSRAVVVGLLAGLPMCESGLRCWCVTITLGLRAPQRSYCWAHPIDFLKFSSMWTLASRRPAGAASLMYLMQIELTQCRSSVGVWCSPMNTWPRWEPQLRGTDAEAPVPRGGSG